MAWAVGTATLGFGAAPGINKTNNEDLMAASGSSGTVLGSVYINDKPPLVVRNSL